VTDSGEPHVPADGWEADLGSGLPVVAPVGDGLRWSFELDLVSVLEAMGRPLRDWEGVDQEADLAAEVASLGFTDTPPEPCDVPPGLPGDWTEPDPDADVAGAAQTHSQPAPWSPGRPAPTALAGRGAVRCSVRRGLGIARR
jgi:hypothetical protein